MKELKEKIDNIVNRVDKLTKKAVRSNKRNPINDWPLNVISTKMGTDRGTAIDRIYIEKFLDMNKERITGEVLEIGSNNYTKKFGQKVTCSKVLTAEESITKKNYIIGDLQSGKGCEESTVNCFILTQTLPFIYDVFSAAGTIVKMLKPGGSAIITVSGISMISKYDDVRWGHYWGFTKSSLMKLFEGLVPIQNIHIVSMGNPKTAAAFLYGLSVEDMEEQDFEQDDDFIPVTLGAVITKPRE